MMRRSGQMGVPVITVDDQVVVGFNEPRLAQLIGASASGGPPRRLGAAVAVAAGGLRVGRVHPGSLAARAGLREGDLIARLNGQAVATPEQLMERLAGPLQRGQPISLTVQRDGKPHELRLAPPFS
jgi:S1-C subfamily serine protease